MNYYARIEQIDKELAKRPRNADELQGERSRLAAVTGLWDEFGDLPMDPETERMEAPFLHFPAGTFREDVWHWFEAEFGLSVATDLMFN